VNPDGTGTAEFSIGTVEPMGFPDVVETFDLVIADKGKELQFIGTNAGSVVRGVSIKQ